MVRKTAWTTPHCFVLYHLISCSTCTWGWTLLLPFQLHQFSSKRTQHAFDDVRISITKFAIVPSVAAALVISACGTPPCSPAYALESTPSASTGNVNSSLVVTQSDSELPLSAYPGLKAPTADKPQITLLNGYGGGPFAGGVDNSMFNVNKIINKNKTPLLQGFVYLKDPTNRPDFTDTLVITASATATDDDNFLLGAKILVTKIPGFPMQINLYRENVRSGKTVSDDTDLWVTARICPETVQTLPCTDQEAVLRARGLSKVLRNLPGMNPGEFTRTAASLGL